MEEIMFEVQGSAAEPYKVQFVKKQAGQVLQYSNILH